MTWVFLAISLVAVLGLGVALAWGRARGRAAAAGGMHIGGILHVNINCSDFDRSRAFYERLGFVVLMDVAPLGEGDVAGAVGMHRYRVRGALMAHRDGSTIDLLEWEEPRDASPPRAGLHLLGLARLALTTSSLDDDVVTLKAAGVRFLSDRPGSVRDPLGGTTRFICFEDPDGTVLELVEMGAIMGALHSGSKRLARRETP